MSLPATGYLENSGRTVAEMKQALEDQRDALSALPGAAARPELTISGGVITPGARDHGAHFRVDTEANAAADDVDIIATTNVQDGAVYRFYMENASRVPTFKHGNGATGEILTVDGEDFSPAALDQWIEVQLRGTSWEELNRSYGADHAADRAFRGISLTVVQAVEATPYTTYSNTTLDIDIDDTIPQNTEGVEVMTVTITPKATANRLVIEAELQMSVSATAVIALALFQDSTANALAASFDSRSATFSGRMQFRHEMAAGTTSATTFKLRAGISTGTLYFNGGGSTRIFGGVAACRMRVTEYSE